LRFTAHSAAEYRAFATSTVFTAGAWVVVAHQRALFVWRPHHDASAAAAAAVARTGSGGGGGGGKTGGTLLLRLERDSCDVCVQTRLGRWRLDAEGRAVRADFAVPSLLELSEVESVLAGPGAAAPATLLGLRACVALPLRSRCLPPLRDRLIFGRWLVVFREQALAVQHPLSALQVELDGARALRLVLRGDSVMSREVGDSTAL
jgi:hypothetical protein